MRHAPHTGIRNHRAPSCFPIKVSLQLSSDWTVCRWR